MVQYNGAVYRTMGFRSNFKMATLDDDASFASLNDKEYKAIINNKDSEATHKSTRKSVNI